MVPKIIHLADAAGPELDGQEVTTDLVIAGIGDTYGFRNGFVSPASKKKSTPAR